MADETAILNLPRVHKLARSLCLVEIMWNVFPEHLIILFFLVLKKMN